MNCKSYERALIGGFPMLMGDPSRDLRFESMFELNIGDKVKTIGRRTISGKESSSCRVHNVNPYMTYSGLYEYDDILYMAFLLPPGGVVGWDEQTPEVDVYGLFAVNVVPGEEAEVVLPNYQKRAPLVFKAKFELYE